MTFRAERTQILKKLEKNVKISKNCVFLAIGCSNKGKSGGCTGADEEGRGNSGVRGCGKTEWGVNSGGISQQWGYLQPFFTPKV